MENTAANQLPEADSLPDGFVDSSAEPLAPSTPMPEEENRVTDYKEEKLVELDSRPEVVVSDFLPSEGVDENTEKLRTFPAQLSENVSCDAQNLVTQVTKPLKDCVEQSDALVMSGSANHVSKDAGRKSEEGLAGLANGEKVAEGTCQSSEKCNNLYPDSKFPPSSFQTMNEANEQGMDTQAVNVQVLSSESSGTSRKVDTSEVKRKSAKRTFKTENEFLEFTLKYQQVLAERDSAIYVRDKLESLCRELQRQNKMLMDECKRASTEGQNWRLDLSNKFRDAIKEVSIKLEEQRDDSLSQLKENEILRNQLKQLTDHYALTEQQFTQQLKQKTLELQIANLKFQQHEEKLNQEQSQMKQYAEQVSQLLATEKKLRLQLTADGEKFQQFHDALVKSNEIFETFKQEIEKMTKSIKELKKENTFLKSKSEKSDITLVELVEECEHLKKQSEKTKNQKEQLESLCRSLQAERKQNSIGQSSSDSVPV